MEENLESMKQPSQRIHPTAEVSPDAEVGEETQVWNWVQIRENAHIGSQCILSKGVYIDKNVSIGNKVKIQNNVSVYEGVSIEDGVFVGPHVCFTNDKLPRAVNEDFELAQAEDWQIAPTLIKKGAAIGANATILPGITIGEFAMIGAGSVVTKDVEDYILVYGNPARAVARVDKAGKIIEKLN